MDQAPKHRLKELPEEEWPRETLIHLGAEKLRDDQLLAILLSTGVRGENVAELAKRMLTEYDGVQGLGKMDYGAMTNIRGIGPAKACTLIAAFELGRRSAIEKKRRFEHKVRVNSPATAAGLVMDDLAEKSEENLWVILLDTKKQLISVDRRYKGSINSAPVRMAELFSKAATDHAESVILVHNHPSGDPTPSAEDVEVTKRAVDAGNMLEIEVVDHIVIGHDRYFSFKEKGLVFK